jgi:PhnB protein
MSGAPDGWRTVTPRIVTPDVDGLIGFLKTVFGASGEVRGGAPLK